MWPSSSFAIIIGRTRIFSVQRWDNVRAIKQVEASDRSHPQLINAEGVLASHRLSLALLMSADIALSSFWTCAQVGQKASQSADQKQAEENCTAFKGPLFTAVRPVLVSLNRYGNAVIAVFTIALVVSTTLLWGSTERAARAAEQAAKHIPTVERAFVFGTPAFKGRSATKPHCLMIKNDGKTPATIKGVCVGTLRSEPFDPIPSYPEGVEQTEIILGAGDAHEHHRSFMSLNPEYLVGYVAYIDIFKNRHVRRFCFRILQSEKRFEMAGHPNWNQEETEEYE